MAGFDLTGLGSVAELLGKGLDKLFPDKSEADKAKLRLMELQQAGEFKELDAQLQIALAQAATNTAEAQSGNAWAGGWRPAAGYVCVTSLAYHFIFRPILSGILPAWHPGLILPPIETADLFYLLSGMLGLGGMRSFEKAKGVAK